MTLTGHLGVVEPRAIRQAPLWTTPLAPLWVRLAGISDLDVTLVSAKLTKSRKLRNPVLSDKT